MLTVSQDMFTVSQDMITSSQGMLPGAKTLLMFHRHTKSLSGHTQMPNKHGMRLSKHCSRVPVMLTISQDMLAAPSHGKRLRDHAKSIAMYTIIYIKRLTKHGKSISRHGKRLSGQINMHSIHQYMLIGSQYIVNSPWIW
jgi:hypothetical protein